VVSFPPVELGWAVDDWEGGCSVEEGWSVVGSGEDSWVVEGGWDESVDGGAEVPVGEEVGVSEVIGGGEEGEEGEEGDWAVPVSADVGVEDGDVEGAVVEGGGDVSLLVLIVSHKKLFLTRLFFLFFFAWFDYEPTCQLSSVLKTKRGGEGKKGIEKKKKRRGLSRHSFLEPVQTPPGFPTETLTDLSIHPRKRDTQPKGKEYCKTLTGHGCSQTKELVAEK